MIMTLWWTFVGRRSVSTAKTQTLLQPLIAPVDLSLFLITWKTLSHLPHSMDSENLFIVISLGLTFIPQLSQALLSWSLYERPEMKVGHWKESFSPQCTLLIDRQPWLQTVTVQREGDGWSWQSLSSSPDSGFKKNPFGFSCHTNAPIFSV